MIPLIFFLLKKLYVGVFMITQNEKDYMIDCQGDACKGDTITLFKEVWISSKLCGTIKLFGKIIDECYNFNGRHEFIIRLFNGAEMNMRGRDLYKYELKRMPWENEKEREDILKEKHMRGSLTRRRTYERTNRKTNSIRDEGTRQFHQRRAS
jgi:hypothetical protein